MARPPRLPDSDILALIAELRARHPALTGTQLRTALVQRHGSPGGVHRVYRLLKRSTSGGMAPVRAAADSPSNDAALAAQLADALARARLAEDREEAHQSRWAGEIHALREQVQKSRGALHRLPILESLLQDRSRELDAAYRRISDLEQQIDPHP